MQKPETSPVRSLVPKFLCLLIWVEVEVEICFRFGLIVEGGLAKTSERWKVGRVGGRGFEEVEKEEDEEFEEVGEEIELGGKTLNWRAKDFEEDEEIDEN